MPTLHETDDPFSAESDPYPPLRHGATRQSNAPEPAEKPNAAPRACECGRSASLSRRQLLSGMGALALLPAVASAEPFRIPCVQEKQQITPCRHKFCKHYGGEGDYHGR